MKKTSAISALYISEIIEALYNSIKELQNFNDNQKHFIEIVVRNNETILGQLINRCVEEYKNEFISYCKEYDVDPVNFDLKLDQFVESLTNDHFYYIDDKNSDKKYKGFIKKLEASAKKFRDKCRIYRLKNENLKEHQTSQMSLYGGSGLDDILQNLKTLKESLENYIEILSSYKKAFPDVNGENARKLKLFLENYLEKLLNESLYASTNFLDTISLETIKQIPIKSKISFNAWLNNYRLENIIDNDKSEGYKEFLKSLQDIGVKEYAGYISKISSDIRHINSKIKTAKNIYNSIADKIDNLDEFGKRKFNKILQCDSYNKINMLQQFSKELNVLEAFYDEETGNISFKKASENVVSLLSKQTNISDKNIKKILGGLIKKGYDFLLVDIFKELFANKEKEWEVAKIIFERMYARKITSVDDFIKYFELFKNLNELQKELAGFDFGNRDFENFLDVSVRYFENINPNKKINIKSLIDSFNTQSKRYVELKDATHNNFDIDNVTVSQDVINKEFEDKIMKVSGGKKYSVPHKDIINVVSSLLGFNGFDEDESLYGYHSEDYIENPIDEKTTKMLDKVILYLNEIYNKYKEKLGSSLYLELGSKISYLENILRSTETNQLDKFFVGKAIVNVFYNNSTLSYNYLKTIAPKETEILKKIVDEMAYECEVPVSLETFVSIQSKKFLESLQEVDDDILLSVGLTKNPLLQKEGILNIEDVLFKLERAFMNLDKYSFSQLKELSDLSKKAMYIINVSSVKGGYKELFNKIQNLNDVENEINYKLPDVKGKHPNLYNLNMDIDDEYRFRVLQPLDARHLTIGIETDCCQRLGGAGESAAIDSFINPLAGVLVLEKKDGTVIGQSYFHYVPQQNMYILDNIEGFPSKIGETKMEEAYFKLANKLKTEYDVNSFRVGQAYTELAFENAGEGTPEYEDEDPRYFAVDDPYSDYTGANAYWDLLKDRRYSNDSKKQEFEYKPFEKALEYLNRKK